MLLPFKVFNSFFSNYNYEYEAPVDYEYPVDYRIVYSGPDPDSVDPSFMYPPPALTSQCPDPSSNYYPSQDCLYPPSQYIPSYPPVNNNNTQCKFFPRRSLDKLGVRGLGRNKVSGMKILCHYFCCDICIVSIDVQI